ncbi:hypothetical protein DOK76_01550 [Vagococcus sp. DIV0080]|uniref:Uncharacterized protein n=1 Tax=Candidatus Vagococcus giribetii TaxID=2230876 RepID=A0ABS3HPR4_9ENTE|nr:hypothetical protein [Vagococcus sp. DIV0080]MBO0475734.1 hypothetical protein [Vagococcus sp. DIV0080]
MDFLKKYTIDLAVTTLGIALLVIGLFFGTSIIVFNLDGFYFFIAGLLLTIYGAGSIIAKMRQEKK